MRLVAAAALLVCIGCSADTAAPVVNRPAATVTSYEVGARPSAVAVADLDADRSLDLAVVNSGADTVTILLGRGGTFRPGGTYPAGKEPCDVEAGDVDRDGDPDLVIANHETSDVTVLMNDGRGGFPAARAVTVSTGARPHIHGVALADFDGDGWLDVAVESADTNEVRLRRGAAGGFGAVTPIGVGTMPYTQVGAADMNGDGAPDVLVPGHGDKTVRLIASSSGNFVVSPLVAATRQTPWTVAGADVDGDSERDLIVVETDAVSVWLKSADQYRAAAWAPLAIPGATAVATGDLDGDRLQDFVVGAWDSAEIIAVAGAAPAPRKVAACARPIGLAIADLDGDGAGEIVATCPTEARVIVLRSPFASRRR